MGTGGVANQKRVYRGFEEARKFVRGLGLKSLQEWRNYLKSGNKPSDIPKSLTGKIKLDSLSEAGNSELLHKKLVDLYRRFFCSFI